MSQNLKEFFSNAAHATIMHLDSFNRNKKEKKYERERKKKNLKIYSGGKEIKKCWGRIWREHAAEGNYGANELN